MSASVTILCLAARSQNESGLYNESISDFVLSASDLGISRL